VFEKYFLINRISSAGISQLNISGIPNSVGIWNLESLLGIQNIGKNFVGFRISYRIFEDFRLDLKNKFFA